MNAIVGLCHFCEAHGPRPLFCTFTTDNENNTTEPSKSSAQCNGCTSLGPETVLITREDDGSVYCSREAIPNTEVTSFLRQAAIRSITCEVSWSKKGGAAYFSDTKGHVLSFTFQVADTRARGLKRWFSIVVLMKDKMFLLNITPMLSEHMKKISAEIQEKADVVFKNEQEVCSQRALRLRTGRNDFGQSRCLMQLTGDEEMFKKLHCHFTWMLKAGALTYSETLYTSQELLDRLQPQTNKYSIFDKHSCEVPSDEEVMALRALENLLSKEVFRILLYCTLTGITITIKCKHTNPLDIANGLNRLLPMVIGKDNPNIKISIDRIDNPECSLEERESKQFYCMCSTAVPDKCPTLMDRIESAMSNPKFNDSVLHHHVKSLQLEWIGLAKTIKAAIDSSGATSPAVIKLQQVLGVTQHDKSLINYWISAFC